MCLKTLHIKLTCLEYAKVGSQWFSLIMLLFCSFQVSQVVRMSPDIMHQFVYSQAKKYHNLEQEVFVVNWVQLAYLVNKFNLQTKPYGYWLSDAVLLVSWL